MTELIRTALLLAMLSGESDARLPAVQAGGTSGIMHRGAAAAGVESPTWPGMVREASPAMRGRDAWLGSDKFQHFGMSYAVTAFTFAGLRAVGAEAGPALAAALPVAAAAGVGKEIHDRRRGDIFSVRDLVADGLGIAAAYFFLREVR